MISEIKDLDPKPFGVQTFNIVLSGEIGAGKSSFYNSVNSIFSERVLPTKAASGQKGKSFTKEFKMYKFRHNPNIRIGDTMGIEPYSSEVDVRNLLKVVEGHVPNGHKFQADEEFLPSNPGYIQRPSLAERAHCLALVINAMSIQNMKDEMVRKLQSLGEGMINRGVPLVIVLTHLDEFLPEVQEDITKTFHSRLLKELMSKISHMVHGLPENLIFPVISYHKQVDLDDSQDVLLLYSLRSMVCAAECYLENQGATAEAEDGATVEQGKKCCCLLF